MSVGTRLRQGASMSFLVHVFTTVGALLVARPLALALESAVRDDPRGGLALGAAGGSVLLETLVERGSVLGALASVTLVLLVAWIAVSPWLETAWLRQLARGDRLSDALGRGARAYWPAVRITLLLAPVLAVALLALVLAPLVIALVLESSPNERTRDLATLVATVPGIVLLALVATWHDLARASLGAAATYGARSSVLRAARSVPRALPAYVAALLLGAAIAALGHALGMRLWSASPLLVLAVQQPLALARTLTRAAWLARAVQLVEGRSA